MASRHQLRPHRDGNRGVRTYTTPGLGRGRAKAALFLDRQAGLVRAICAREAPVEDFTTIRRSLDRMRDAGARIGVASHNRADGWDTFDLSEIEAMHRRLEMVLGAIDLWCVCLVDAGGTCACRIPEAGVLASGAQAAGLSVDDCAVATDDGRLREAAERTGAANVLRPAEAVALAGALEAVVG